MGFTEEHLREVRSSDSIDEALIRSSHQLSTVRGARETVHRTEILCFHNGRCVLMVGVKENDLAVTTANADLLRRDSDDVSDSESHQVNGKDKHLVLHLESNKISRSSSTVKIVFSTLGVSHASVLSHHTSCTDQFVRALSSDGVELPHS